MLQGYPIIQKTTTEGYETKIYSYYLSSIDATIIDFRFTSDSWATEEYTMVKFQYHGSGNAYNTVFANATIKPFSDYDNVYDLRSSSARWANVYAANVRPNEIIFPADDGVEYLIRTEDSKALISLMGGSDPDIKFALNSIVVLEIPANGMGICVDWSVLPRGDNLYWLGANSKRWAEVHAVNVYTGDINLDNGWKITEYNDDGEIIRGIRILNDKNEEVFRVTEDGVWFKGKKIAE